MITSALTLIQSFSLNTILGFLESVVILLYLFHTMFRDTIIWKDYHLGKSPFNELKNDGYYYALLVLVAFNLAVNLISTVVVSGLFVSILDALYLLLLGRYVYLYREYLDYYKLDSNNEGNFNELRDNISNNIDDVKEKINDVLDKTDIDDKIIEATSKIKESAKDVLDKTDVDDKIIEATNKVKDSAKDLIYKKDKDEKESKTNNDKKKGDRK